MPLRPASRSMAAPVPAAPPAPAASPRWLRPIVLVMAMLALLAMFSWQRNAIFIGVIAPIAIASYLPKWKLVYRDKTAFAAY